MITEMVEDMMMSVQEDYKLNGHITPAVLLVSKAGIAMYPTKMIELMSKDKGKFLREFRSLLTANKSEAGLILFSASYVSCDNKSPWEKEFVFIFANEKTNQTIYFSEIKDKKMSEWRRLGTRDEVNHDTWLGGSFYFFYRLGAVKGGKDQRFLEDVPKIDI